MPISVLYPNQRKLDKFFLMRGDSQKLCQITDLRTSLIC